MLASTLKLWLLDGMHAALVGRKPTSRGTFPAEPLCQIFKQVSAGAGESSIGAYNSQMSLAHKSDSWSASANCPDMLALM
jgi:hypothetical protein